jgi:hypothetical protein
VTAQNPSPSEYQYHWPPPTLYLSHVNKEAKGTGSIHASDLHDFGEAEEKGKDGFRAASVEYDNDGADDGATGGEPFSSGVGSAGGKSNVRPITMTGMSIAYEKDGIPPELHPGPGMPKYLPKETRSRVGIDPISGTASVMAVKLDSRNSAESIGLEDAKGDATGGAGLGMPLKRPTTIGENDADAIREVEDRDKDLGIDAEAGPSTGATTDQEFRDVRDEAFHLFEGDHSNHLDSGRSEQEVLGFMNKRVRD